MTDIDAIVKGLSKAQREALPKARLLSVSWQGWRYSGLYRHRGANFCRQVVGPVCLTWRMPWLEYSARTLYPQMFAVRDRIMQETGK